MNHKLPRLFVVALIYSGFFLGLGCNDSSFSGSSNSQGKLSDEKDDSGDDQDAKKLKNGTDHAQGKNDDLSEGDTADATPQCLSKPVDVRIIFALDSTGSMQESIDLVKTNVQAFSGTVKNIQFGSSVEVINVEVGLVSYRDTASDLRKISFGSLEDLVKSLSFIQADGGGDTFESGLLAAQTALALMLEKPIDPAHDVLPVLVIVTDTYSHNGEGTSSPPLTTSEIPRDCLVSWQPLQQTMSRELYDRLVIYDASPAIDPFLGATGPDVPRCKGYQAPSNSPSQQWEDLRIAWQKAGSGRREKPALGRGFGFPFTSDSLLNSLPQDIAASFKACENK